MVGAASGTVVSLCWVSVMAGLSVVEASELQTIKPRLL